MTYTDIPGWFDFQELYNEAAEKATNASVLVEVGCWRGRSLAFLAQRLKALGKHPRLFAVDTWAGSPGEDLMAAEVAELGGPQGLWLEFNDNMIGCGIRSMIIPMRMESAQAARFFAPDGTGPLPAHGEIEFCFIDAGHDLQSMRTDLAAWVPKMKPGGLIAGHDLYLQTVRQAVEEAFGTSWETRGSCWAKRIPEGTEALCIPA